MLRVALTIVLPLLLPTALYLLWVRLRQGPDSGGRLRWAALPWLWLAGAGLLLLTLMLFIVTIHFGSTAPGIYIPPRWQDGQIIPGHIEPRRGP